MPVADNLNLELVSMTTRYKKEPWMVTFLHTCWALREDPDYPCDVHSISAWAIHNYTCSERMWNRRYGGTHSNSYQQRLIRLLGEGEGIDWAEYVLSKQLWVTETNCNWDGDEPDAEEQCRRMTG